MKKFLSTFLSALLLSALFVSPALACGDHEEHPKQEEKK